MASCSGQPRSGTYTPQWGIDGLAITGNSITVKQYERPFANTNTVIQGIGFWNTSQLRFRNIAISDNIVQFEDWDRPVRISRISVGIGGALATPL